MCKAFNYNRKVQNKSKPIAGRLTTIKCEDGSEVECKQGTSTCFDNSPSLCNKSASEDPDREVYNEGEDPFVVFSNDHSSWDSVE